MKIKLDSVAASCYIVCMMRNTKTKATKGNTMYRYNKWTHPGTGVTRVYVNDHRLEGVVRVWLELDGDDEYIVHATSVYNDWMELNTTRQSYIDEMHDNIANELDQETTWTDITTSIAA